MPFEVPLFIKLISKEKESKKYSILFDIVCECGNREFEVIKNNRNKEKEVELDRWFYEKELFWKKRFWMIYSTHPYIDKKDGKMYEYGKTVFGIRIGKFCLENKPKYFKTSIIKTYCHACKKEHILFDNRINGLNAYLSSDNYEDEVTYSKFKHFESKDQMFSVEIELINDYKIKKLSKKLNKELSLENYSNLFTKINIIGTIKSQDKKILIHSEETK